MTRTLSRVPPLVSMDQEQDGRNCLRNCCVPGARFPLYTFGWRSTLPNTFGDMEQQSACKPLVPSTDPSLLDSLILSKWEDCAERGLFRYDVTGCETKILAGELGFIAQLNEGRQSKKRPTEFRVDRVLQSFDPKKFNFTKVGPEEVLFLFEESGDGLPEYYDDAPIESASPNVVVINVSPIEHGHILLVPRVMDCIPQRIDPDTLLLALHMTAEVNNVNFRVGYNSLGAFATINQLHFQAYYLEATFPLERAETAFVSYPRGEGGVKISQVVNYPVRTLVFEIGSSLAELADEAARACMILQDANIPYNMLIVDRGAKIFVIPQCYAERQAKGEVNQAVLNIGVNPAAWEISGHVILFRRDDYEMATETSVWNLLAEVSLSEDRFEKVKQMCLDDVFKDDTVSFTYRNIGKLKAKVRKSMELDMTNASRNLPQAGKVA